jgi:IS30 family transposase
MFHHAKSYHVSTMDQIIDAISIRDRLPEIEDRATLRYWKGDLIIGSNNTAIATVVERHSRLTVLCKLESRKVTGVVEALTD